MKDCIKILYLSFSIGNPYSSQTATGLLKCPTPPPAKSQSLNRKHSMELGQVGLLSPASLSPMGSAQSEYIQVWQTIWLLSYISHCCKNDLYWNDLNELFSKLKFSRTGIFLLVMKIELDMALDSSRENLSDFWDEVLHQCTHISLQYYVFWVKPSGF